MKTADIIIGANYGDEGKGLTTDACAARFDGDCIVVRFNGGAQAGHTVTTPEGQRHVFSHFGSGSFSEAETFLSRFFVCNPLLMRKEHALLAKLGVDPVVRIDARAPVTTPYDMMVNQIAEESRGAGRHGSCGMGFGETLARQEAGPQFVAQDLWQGTTHLRSKLDDIRKNWMMARLASLGVASVPPHWRERIESNAIADKFAEDVDFFCQQVLLAPVGALGAMAKPLVFEGAQGLLLDQDRGAFPHVTRSNTGLRNVLSIVRDETTIDSLRVHYITRIYLTRHGAGPLANELPDKPHPRIQDATNIPNDWQGALRFAPLDAGLLAKSIADDLSDAKNSGIDINTRLVVSCLDQVDERCSYLHQGKTHEAAPDVVAADLQKICGADALITSRGPTRRDVCGI